MDVYKTIEAPLGRLVFEDEVARIMRSGG